MKYYLQGLTMGLAYVAPIGVQNLFVINSAVTYKRYRALLNAFIVIFFDISLSFACFFGIGSIMQHYEWIKMLMLVIGSIVVIYIGISLLKSKEEDIKVSKKGISIPKTILTACVVTWFNPQAIIDGTMMLGAFYATLPVSQSSLFILGVVSASCLWFTSLTLLISFFSNRFNVRILRKINIVCGIVIVFYGLKLVIDFLKIYCLH